MPQTHLQKDGEQSSKTESSTSDLMLQILCLLGFHQQKMLGKTGHSIYNIVHNQLYLRDDSVDMGGKERKGCTAGMMTPFLRAFPI